MFKRRVEDSGKCSVWRFAFRLFYTHIANVLIMLVVAMLVDNLSLIKIQVSDSLTPIAVTFVTFIFYVAYTYIQSWRVGQRDYNLVLYKHDDYMSRKALYAALISQLPGFLLAIAVQFPQLGFAPVRYARYFNLHFNWFLVTYGDTLLWLYFVPLVIAPIVASLAYNLGYKGIYLADKVMFQSPDKHGKTQSRRRGV